MQEIDRNLTAHKLVLCAVVWPVRRYTAEGGYYMQILLKSGTNYLDHTSHGGDANRAHTPTAESANITNNYGGSGYICH